MSGFEIFLLILVVIAILVIAYQARQNRDLARRLWQQIAEPQPGVLLPPAAETISLEAFHRATDRAAADRRWLEGQLQKARAEARDVLAKAETSTFLNQVGAALVADYAMKHAQAEAEAQRLAGLYMAAERERERQARELQRLRGEQGFIAVVH